MRNIIKCYAFLFFLTCNITGKRGKIKVKNFNKILVGQKIFVSLRYEKDRNKNKQLQGS